MSQSEAVSALDNLDGQDSRQYDTFAEDFYRVYHREFATLLHPEVVDLCAMCNQLLLTHRQNRDEVFINSGGVYRFIMECTRCEDLLDQVHADQQVDWACIRKLAALIKHSCSITANLQYLSVLAEKLIGSVEGNFAMANRSTLHHFYSVLLENSQNFLNEVWRLGVLEADFNLPLIFDKYFTPDIKSLIRLKTGSSFQPVPPNGESDAEHTREIILYLVSTLLYNCDVIDYLGPLLNMKTSKRQEIISNDLHEESLTAQGELFHSIITFFDTQCSQKQLVVDAEVFKLIDYVKVIYQLFMGFSTLMRIEERHSTYFAKCHFKFSLNNEIMQDIIFDFFINYVDRFRLQIEKISKCLIQKYSVQEQIDLPIPSYRGFHVRPSTLVARIVMHYGSKVTMSLKNTSYDAAVPLDLFRANEVINAEKRREIGKIIIENTEYLNYSKRLRKNPSRDQVLLQQYLLGLFQSLQQREKIVTYEALSLSALELPLAGEDFLEYAKREVAYLMAMGKIDIASCLMVSFTGDSRVLADVAILAKHGYGEDKNGNNIPLPKELSYLRR